MKDLAKQEVCINAIRVSHKLKVNVILAAEMLQTAEKLLYLCRDVNKVETGIMFYSNLFNEL